MRGRWHEVPTETHRRTATNVGYECTCSFSLDNLEQAPAVMREPLGGRITQINAAQAADPVQKHLVHHRRQRRRPCWGARGQNSEQAHRKPRVPGAPQRSAQRAPSWHRRQAAARRRKRGPPSGGEGACNSVTLDVLPRLRSSRGEIRSRLHAYTCGAT